MWKLPEKPPSLAAFYAYVVLGASLLIGGVYAQNPGTGPNVGALGPYGPPFTFLNGHFVPGITAVPTINGACGTGATIVGTDTAMLLVSGTSSNAGCQITPAAAWKQRPICNIDAQAASQPNYAIASNGVITVLGVADSTTYNIQCIGQPGG